MIARPTHSSGDTGGSKRYDEYGEILRALFERLSKPLAFAAYYG